MNDKETLPEQDTGPESSPRRAPDVVALILAWSHDEPWRLGQAIVVPSGNPGATILFGRGPADQPGKALLQEQRPGRSSFVPPLESAAVSRTQLEIRGAGADRIFVRNLGKCPLLRDAAPISEGEFRVGETLQLGKQLLFFVTRRPSTLGVGDPTYPDFPFGEVDPFGIVGESAEAWHLRGQIALMARRRGHVLVSGPSGTGKELVARAIHALSDRKRRPLVARNAATLPEALIVAELFGNAKNYPNPGMPDRPGLIGQADGSTLFLDEVGELPVMSQAQLLRVLDDGEYHRLGEGASRRSDLRLIAATNRDLAALKHDLLARLTFRLESPSLDARRDDIPLIVRHIVRRSARAGDEIARRLLPRGDPAAQPDLKVGVIRALFEMRYELNVRQLESTLWKLLAAPEMTTRIEPTQPHREPSRPLDAPAQSSSDDEEDGWTPERIQRCLDEHNGVLELTWRALGMKNRFVLLRAIKKHGLVVGRRPGQGPLRRSTRDR